MTKKVDFAGQTWDVPDWANYITQDSGHGAVIAWEKIPERNENGIWRSCGKDLFSPGKSEVLGYTRIQPLINAI